MIHRIDTYIAFYREERKRANFHRHALPFELPSAFLFAFLEKVVVIVVIESLYTQVFLHRLNPIG